MLNVLKRGVHVGAVLIPEHIVRKDPEIVKPLVELCGGCTEQTVEGVWYNPDGRPVYDCCVYYDFCMFDTTRINEFEPLLLKLAEKLRELGEQSVMLWGRSGGGVLVPYLYEGV